jgi:hypothetical protein
MKFCLPVLTSREASIKQNYEVLQTWNSLKSIVVRFLGANNISNKNTCIWFIILSLPSALLTSYLTKFTLRCQLGL